MYDSLRIRILSIFLGFLFFLTPVALQASEIDISSTELESAEKMEAPTQMTQKQMNDLFGEDPYLGQTSYLQSPGGFSQRDKSK